MITIRKPPGAPVVNPDPHSRVKVQSLEDKKLKDSNDVKCKTGRGQLGAPQEGEGHHAGSRSH